MARAQTLIREGLVLCNKINPVLPLGNEFLLPNERKNILEVLYVFIDM